jgi:hypothetical protein
VPHLDNRSAGSPDARDRTRTRCGSEHWHRRWRRRFFHSVCVLRMCLSRQCQMATCGAKRTRRGDIARQLGTTITTGVAVRAKEANPRPVQPHKSLAVSADSSPTSESGKPKGSDVPKVCPPWKLEIQLAGFLQCSRHELRASSANKAAIRRPQYAGAARVIDTVKGRWNRWALRVRQSYPRYQVVRGSNFPASDTRERRSPFSQRLGA